MATIVTLNAGTESPELFGFLWNDQAELFAELSIQRSDVESVAATPVDILDRDGADSLLGRTIAAAQQEV